MRAPFSFLKQSYITSGVDGDLVINSGNYSINGVVFPGAFPTLSGGVTKQYRSIQINTGGILRIDGDGITHLAAQKYCIIDGQIICNWFGNATTLIGSFFNGLSLTFNQGGVASGNGGAGGTGEGFRAGGTPGLGFSGGGGGGGGGANINPDIFGLHNPGDGGTAVGGSGQDSSDAAGGFGLGGVGTLIDLPGTAGILATGHGGDGSAGGGGGAYHANFGIVAGGGGGGGCGGRHGSKLDLFVEGIVSGAGTVDARGLAGHTGGIGGDAQGGGGGGGGGGGSGGHGGIVYLQRKSGTISVLVSSGLGGAGGAGGARSVSGSPTYSNGSSGTSGSAGLIGTYIPLLL